MGKIVARPTIANTAMATANKEYSYALPAGTTRFTFKLRNPGYPAKVCFVSGASGTIYQNLANGQTYREKDIKKGDIVLYFQSTGTNQVAELMSWV